MPVSSKHADLIAKLPYYTVINDCLSGEIVIKNKKTTYLPMPNSDDQSTENVARYNAYLTRAVFYGVTKRTLGGLIGQVFARDPFISVPEILSAIINDATGSGVNIIQFAKTATEYVISRGRAGILVDYPDRDTFTSVEQLMSGDVRPNMTFYPAERIINWDVFKKDGRILLSLVVLEEPYVIRDDGFSKTMGTQYRVLRLTNNVYTINIYRNDAVYQSFSPVDADGKSLTEIPFTFIGSRTNDSSVDDPPLYDLASLNISHYRNSADYEESCFVVGQPTLVLTGLTQQWVQDVLKGKVQLGSRGAVPLPADADAQMLQAAPNSLPFEAMKHKEKQMVALGAKLIEDISVQRTATETAIDFSSETSVLSATADNVSDAVAKSLKWCAQFVGADGAGIEFALNTEFDLIRLSPQDRVALIGEWQAGAISFGELRDNLRRGGIVTRDDDEAKAIIEAEIAERDKKVLEKQKMLADASGNNKTGQQVPS